MNIWAAQEKNGERKAAEPNRSYVVTRSVCSQLFSGVRTLGPCPQALIYPSSITDVSAVIYELQGAGWRRKGWDLAGGGLGPHGRVMVGDRVIVCIRGLG